MTDKEKILAEIERLKDKGKYSDTYDYAFRDGNNGALDAIARFISSLPEEPVSEDLEEAAKNHAVERYRVTRDRVLAEKCKWSLQTGAKWKEKQMMSKAVDAHVNYVWSGLSFGGFDWSKTGLDIGDKCKLIIINED